MRKKDLLDRSQKGDGDLYPQFLLPPGPGGAERLLGGHPDSGERPLTVARSSAENENGNSCCATREILRGRRYDGARAVRATAP